MAYKSQLVVRSRDARGTEIIDRVKQLADAQDKTYSQMALELLTVGLEGGPPAKDPEPKPKQSTQQAAEPAPADEPADDASKAAPPPKKAPAKAPAQDAPEPVDIPDGSSVEDVADLCAESFEDAGIAVASRVLAQFFVTCGPAEGGQIKDELQGRLDDGDYEDLFEALRDTDEYRDYRKRVIFGS
jgi:hypothetical protein